MKNSCYEDYRDLEEKLGVNELHLNKMSIYRLKFNTITYNLYNMGCTIPECENLIVKEIGNVYKSYGADNMTFADVEISLDATNYLYCNCTNHDIYLGRSVNNGHTLNRIDLYGRIRGIYDYAYYKSLKLSKIIFPAGLKEIGNNAFHFCSRLTDINLEICKELEYIGESAFMGCYIKMLDLSETNLKSIGKGAFSANQPLQKVFLPETLTYLGEGCFSNCRNLKYINIPGSVSEIKSELLTAGYNVRIEIGEGVKTIRRNAFMCADINEITIPKSVKQFARECFYGCRVERMNLPKEIFEYLKSNGWVSTRSELESYIVGYGHKCNVELY